MNTQEETDRKAQAYNDHISGLKRCVADAIDGYVDKNGVRTEDVGFLATDAAATIAAALVQKNDGRSNEMKAVFLKACEEQWNFVNMIFGIKDDYDQMSPEKRQAVINGGSENQ